MGLTPRTEVMAYISCEGCDQTWSWAAGDRATMTFADWYGFLDDILLNHLASQPLCWANLTRLRTVQ